MSCAWVLSIGTELTLGQTVDTNSAWLSARLAERGFRVHRHITLADDMEDIVETLRSAAQRCDLIAISGGLGPTEDDLTRVALARAAGLELERNLECLEQIRAYFDRIQRPMSQSNEVQADLPRGATPLHNISGTAPGIWLRIGRAIAFSLPGVPHEMKQMFEHQVASRLANLSAGQIVRSRRLNCFGAGESQIGETIRDLMQRGRNPEVGTTAQLGVVGIRVNAQADSAAEAERMLDETCAELHRRLGALIYGVGEETLADAVGRLLIERGASLCVAESCTGGLLAKLLTDIPGSSRYFLGGCVTYSNESKIAQLGVDPGKIEQFGAVSAEVARSMADGARTRFGATWAVSITGVAGPGGGTPAKPVGLVYIGVADVHSVTAHEIRLPEHSPRGVIRERSAATALNLLRLRIIESGASLGAVSGR